MRFGIRNVCLDQENKRSTSKDNDVDHAGNFADDYLILRQQNQVTTMKRVEQSRGQNS